MKIGIAGTRGIPAKYGGFETFAEQISIRLVQQGYQCTVYCDKESYTAPEYKNVRLRYSRYTKSGNPLLYYLHSVYMALKENDVVLMTGTGGSVFYFLNLFFRKKLLTNTDGIESKRSKWGALKKMYVRFSETMAVKCSTHLIADSVGIERYLKETYSKHPPVTVIEYGAEVFDGADEKVLSQHNLQPYSYYLVIARLEPENNILPIIEGYLQANTSFPLIIVGNVLNTEYVNELQQYSGEKVLFIGGIYDADMLQSLRFYCKAYFHGHSVGGTNPSLLEALGNGNICICHDNEFNREVTKDNMYYFKTPADIPSLIQEVEQLSEKDRNVIGSKAKERVSDYYNWTLITEKYSRLFNTFELPKN